MFTNPNATKQERLDFILQQINIHTRVTFHEIAKMLQISEDTARRDINELVEQNKAIKIKGGAMAQSYEIHNSKETYAYTQKKIIAEKALSLIPSSSIVLIGGGTTLLEFIKVIPDDFEATFMTVSVLTAAELLKKSNINTIFIGGRISKYSQMAVSGEVFSHLGAMKPDYCILGTNAIDDTIGLSDADWDTVQLKKKMIQCANETIILSISEKLNSEMPIQIASLSEINYLVTELDPNSPVLQSYKNSNLKII